MLKRQILYGSGGGHEPPPYARCAHLGEQAGDVVAQWALPHVGLKLLEREENDDSRTILTAVSSETLARCQPKKYDMRFASKEMPYSISGARKDKKKSHHLRMARQSPVAVYRGMVSQSRRSNAL